MKTSAHGAINVLGLAKRAGARVLQAGDPDEHPQREHYRGHVKPIGPRACYDECKRCAETLFFAYRRQHGVRVKVARISNTYRPRMRPDDGRVVSNFIVQALKNEPITIYGDGDQTRAFCYGDDVVDALVRLRETPNDCCGPVNPGNPREHSVRGLAETVTRLTGTRSPLSFHPLPANDPTRRCPEIGKARELLGWAPRIDLEEGLQRTIGYFAEPERSR